MKTWRQLTRFTQGCILIMVSVLFFGWGIFGQTQVTRQTEDILRGVRVELQRSHAHLEETQETLLRQEAFLACVLALDPDHRTPKRVHRCERQAGR